MKKTTSPEALAKLQALIKKHGGMAPLARELGINAPAVQQWVARQAIPKPWQMLMAGMEVSDDAKAD